MNETVTKRFLLYFRLMLLVWILIANAVIHLTGMEYSWLCAARRSRAHKKVYFCRYPLIFLLRRATISVVSSCPKH